MKKKLETREEGIEFLKLFIQKSDELHNRAYFDGGESILSFRVTPTSDGKRVSEFNYPDNESRDSILLILRMFWQKNDYLHYLNFLYLINILAFSEEWKNEVKFLIHKFDIQLNMNCISGKFNYSYKDLFEICLYGDASHLSQREKYLELTHNYECQDLVDSIFHEMIIKFSCTIMSLANASRKELLVKGLLTQLEYEKMESIWNKKPRPKGKLSTSGK